MSMFFKTVLILVLSVALSAPSVLADSGSITLLAISTSSDEGVLAEVHLETIPGTGRIFIESSLVSKIDTQISTKFANEIACDYLNRDCNELDFFYAIDSNARIIGGPSAGAAIAALTIAVLDDIEINQSVTITGTINSGSIIGNVGGIYKKIDAAAEKNLKKVLVPKGSPDNATKYGKEKGIEVIKVFDIGEAVFEVTGKQFEPEKTEIKIVPEYDQIMKKLADDLCQRTELLEERTNQIYSDKNDDILNQIINVSQNLSEKGKTAGEENHSYARASFCFGANVRYHYVILADSNLTPENLSKEIARFEKRMNQTTTVKEDANTISDLQTLGIVGNRFEDAREKLSRSKVYLEEGNLSESLFELAFSYERFESALAWSQFFGIAENERELSQKMVKVACEIKAKETVELVEYSRILTKQSIYGNEAIIKIDKLISDDQYARCLYEAMLLKAETNFILNSFENTDIEEIVEGKTAAAEIIISRQNQKNLFPIVGYSYYEYAKSLKDSDPLSALKFAEYGLEFSHLDHYFREEKERMKRKFGNTRGNSIGAEYVLGIFTGVFIFLFALSQIFKCNCRRRKLWSRMKRSHIKR